MKIKPSMFVKGGLKVFGCNLFMERQEKGLSLQEVFEKTGMSVADIEKIELGRFGENELIDLDEVFKLITLYQSKIDMQVYE